MSHETYTLGNGITMTVPTGSRAAAYLAGMCGPAELTNAEPTNAEQPTTDEPGGCACGDGCACDPLGECGPDCDCEDAE